MAKRKTKSGAGASRRRAQNALELAERELASDSSSDEGISRGQRKRNSAIVNPQRGSDDENGSEEFEDEELDSDEALGSDDDYDVMNSKFSQSIRDKKKNGAAVDELDEEGGYTSIDEEELLPLSAVWDMDDSTAAGAAKRETTQLQLNDDDLSDDSESESESSSESSEEVENAEDPFDEVSDEEVELATVSSTLQKNTTKQYKRLDTYAGGVEDEYALPSLQGPGKLDITKLLDVVDDPEAVEQATLLKGSLKALDVPLPMRIQQRHERKAAYEISKEEMSKWASIVQQNRQAEHLSFPMDGASSHTEASAFTRNSGKPLTEVEAKVTEVLKNSNLLDPVKENTFNDLAEAKLSVEDMKKRTAELRLMRELMFREERKAKRIKKIKSKAYRRIKKKEMLKNQELVESDESDTDRDVARARERMSLKHNTKSKWARDMVKHGITKDKETRDDLEEMLRQGERLREKVMGHAEGSESDTDVSDLEKDDESPELDAPSRGDVGKTGVLNMAFMKNAEAREREENRKNIAALRAVENGEDIKLFEDGLGEQSSNVAVNKGRRVYSAADLEAKEKDAQFNEQVLSEHAEDESRSLQKRLEKATNRSGTQNNKSEKRSQSSTKKQDNKSEDSSAAENPWLDDGDDTKMTKKSSKIKVVDANSSQFTKSAHKIDKEKQKLSRSKKDGKDEGDDLLLDIESSNKLDIIDPYDDSGDERDGYSFKQQDAINEAFAGDDVVAKFQEEKKRVAIDEDDKEEDVTLPGWGDWAGAGAQPTKKRKFTKKIKGVVSKEKRRDKNLKNVIINEKVNKKNVKYQSSAVPFPFESREQYERSLRMPLGEQWVSRATHQKAVKPRILTKPSVVIDPLKAPFK
ncbi:AaceriADL353Cp [[Ashbya] aceris (nom. inval.)]|nr:AaceriADL353Cp [[Ashbya] aceris (nom. inval.)]